MALPAPRQSHLHSRASAVDEGLLLVRGHLAALIVQQHVRRDAGLELLQLLRTGQVLQQVVLPLELVVLLRQLLDLLLEDLHLLANSVHQMVLNQVLSRERREETDQFDVQTRAVVNFSDHNIFSI